jgi:hypothetical protein
MSRLRLALPPGHVDAHCLVCRVDVAIPEGTLRCPHGDHDVEPTSLPRMPKPEPPARTVPEVVAVGGRRDAPPEPAARGSVEPIELPPSDGALAWYADTRRLRDDLLDEEVALAERLKRVRGMRKRLDLVAAMFVAPVEPAVESGQPPALPAAETPPEPPAAREPQPAGCGRRHGRAHERHGQDPARTRPP